MGKLRNLFKKAAEKVKEIITQPFKKQSKRKSGIPDFLKPKKRDYELDFNLREDDLLRTDGKEQVLMPSKDIRIAPNDVSFYERQSIDMMIDTLQDVFQPITFVRNGVNSYMEAEALKNLIAEKWNAVKSELSDREIATYFTKSEIEEMGDLIEKAKLSYQYVIPSLTRVLEIINHGRLTAEEYMDAADAEALLETYEADVSDELSEEEKEELLALYR